MLFYNVEQNNNKLYCLINKIDKLKINFKIYYINIYVLKLINVLLIKKCTLYIGV